MAGPYGTSKPFIPGGPIRADQSGRTKVRRRLFAVIMVAWALSSPVWLVYGFYLVSDLVPTSQVKIMNVSVEVLADGDYSAYGRNYKFGPINPGESSSFAIFAPEERSVSRVHVRFASGATLDGEGFLYAPWFGTETFKVTAAGVEEVLHLEPDT